MDTFKNAQQRKIGNFVDYSVFDDSDKEVILGILMIFVNMLILANMEILVNFVNSTVLVNIVILVNLEILLKCRF